MCVLYNFSLGPSISQTSLTCVLDNFSRGYSISQASLTCVLYNFSLGHSISQTSLTCTMYNLSLQMLSSLYPSPPLPLNLQAHGNTATVLSLSEQQHIKEELGFVQQLQSESGDRNKTQPHKYGGAYVMDEGIFNSFVVVVLFMGCFCFVLFFCFALFCFVLLCLFCFASVFLKETHSQFIPFHSFYTHLILTI